MKNDPMPPVEFQKTPVLEDERVLLRGIRTEDVKHLLSISENEPETWYYSSQNAAGKKNLENYIRRALSALAEKKEYLLSCSTRERGAPTITLTTLTHPAIRQ